MPPIASTAPIDPPPSLSAPPSRWAWFGTQVGCTAWMLTGMLEAVGGGPPIVVLTWLACFAASNAAGWWLWRQLRRGQVRPFRALQWLVADAMLFGLIAMTTAHRFGPPPRGADEWPSAYRTVLVGGTILIGAFGLQDRANGRAARSGTRMAIRREGQWPS